MRRVALSSGVMVILNARLRWIGNCEVAKFMFSAMILK